MKSKFMTLNWRDFLIGLLIAFLTAVLTGVITILDNGAVFTWLTVKPVLIAGLSAGLSYIVKCLATNSKDQMFRGEPKFA